VSQAAPEPAFGVQVPVASGLPRGQHLVHISAGQGAVVDGFVVQDRPAWPLRWAAGAGAMVVGVAALGWLVVLKRA
jgi:hypothetical protein